MKRLGFRENFADRDERQGNREPLQRRAFPEPSVFCIGDLPPNGYLERQEWARVQLRGGLRQLQCDGCNLWLFPQERATHKCDQRRVRRHEI